MAYTQADLDNIRTARLNLALGKRVGSVTIAGDTFTYDSVSDRDLERLEGIVSADLDTDWNPMSTASNGGRG